MCMETSYHAPYWGTNQIAIRKDGLHVGPEAVYLPIDEDDFWRVLLVKALEALRVEEV